MLLFLPVNNEIQRRGQSLYWWYSAIPVEGTPSSFFLTLLPSIFQHLSLAFSTLFPFLILLFLSFPITFYLFFLPIPSAFISPFPLADLLPSSLVLSWKNPSEACDFENSNLPQSYISLPPHTHTHPPQCLKVRKISPLFRVEEQLSVL